MVLHQHAHARDSHIIKNGIPIILNIECTLRPDISRLDSLKKLHSLRISDRNHKSMNPISALIDDQLRINCSVGAVKPQITHPPLGCSNFWCIYDERFSCGIIGCSSHQTLNIRTMRQLCLGVTPKDLASQSRLQKELFLLFVAQVVQGRKEHEPVERKGNRVCKDICLKFLIAAVKRVKLMKSKKALRIVFHRFCTRLMQDGRIESEFRVILELLEDFSEAIKVGLSTEKMVWKGFFIEGGAFELKFEHE